MKNRRILALLSMLLIITMLFCACGGSEGGKKKNKQQTDTSTMSPTPENEGDVPTSPSADPGQIKPSKEELFNEIKNSRDEMPYIYIKSDVTSVKRGDAFELEVYIANGKNTASYGISIPFDPDIFEVVKKTDLEVGTMLPLNNLETGNMVVAAYAPVVEDLEDEAVFSAKIRVKDDAPTINYEFLAKVDNYQLCAKDDGYNAVDVTKFVKIPDGSLVITITD